MMAVSKVIRNPLWATLVGALVAAMGVSFFVFVQSGEALPRAAADEQPSSASVVNPMIIGGTAVPNGKYPFVALVKVYRKGKLSQGCAGSLIDRNSVLTAAHCLTNSSGAVVVVGRTDRSQQKKGQEIGASTPFTHPLYKPLPKTSVTGGIDSYSRRHPKREVGAYDVAVLKLKRAVKGIKPIKLATTKQNNLERPGRKLTVAGWGVTSEKAKKWQLRMRQVSVPVVSDSRADRAYASLPPSKRLPYVPSLMVAAGKKGKDACYGDSGGPLFDPGSRTQVGISSEGHGCARARYPGIYTEVNNSNIRNFIVSAAKR
jgi:secreted trypsin-like serine protease